MCAGLQDLLQASFGWLMFGVWVQVGDRARFDSNEAAAMADVVQQLSIDAGMWPQWPEES